MKTKKELNATKEEAIKEKVEDASEKPNELSDEELEKVSGGADVTAGQYTVRVQGDGIVKASGTIDGLSYSGTSDLVINSYGGIEIPVIATDKKGDIIVFKIDAPAE